MDLFENAITPSFMEKTFHKISVVVASSYCFVPIMFYYQAALLTGSDVIICNLILGVTFCFLHC